MSTQILLDQAKAYRNCGIDSLISKVSRVDKLLGITALNKHVCYPWDCKELTG